jgi:hypothetical protein
MRGAKIFICCSPDARVGVSTTARLLTDYHLFRGGRVEGFDTDPHEPCYGALFPDLVATLDANDIRGQISLFDRLLEQSETPKIVDVWHRSYARFFDTVREIGFIEEARARGITPILLYHIDASEAALAESRALSCAWPDSRLVAVANEGAAMLGTQSREILSHYPAYGKIIIAELQGPVAKALSDPSLSFSKFLHEPPPAMSIVVRSVLKAWIARIFTQFGSLELRLEMESDLFSD